MGKLEVVTTSGYVEAIRGKTWVGMERIHVACGKARIADGAGSSRGKAKDRGIVERRPSWET